MCTWSSAVSLPQPLPPGLPPEVQRSKLEPPSLQAGCKNAPSVTLLPFSVQGCSGAAPLGGGFSGVVPPTLLPGESPAFWEVEGPLGLQRCSSAALLLAVGGPYSTTSFFLPGAVTSSWQNVKGQWKPPQDHGTWPLCPPSGKPTFPGGEGTAFRCRLMLPHASPRQAPQPEAPYLSGNRLRRGPASKGPGAALGDSQGTDGAPRQGERLAGIKG